MECAYPGYTHYAIAGRASERPQWRVKDQMPEEATVVGLLLNTANPTTAESQARDFQAAARALGLELHIFHASTASAIDEMFAGWDQLRVGALVIGADPFFNTRVEQLAA